MDLTEEQRRELDRIAAEVNAKFVEAGVALHRELMRGIEAGREFVESERRMGTDVLTEVLAEGGHSIETARIVEDLYNHRGAVLKWMECGTRDFGELDPTTRPVVRRYFEAAGFAGHITLFLIGDPEHAKLFPDDPDEPEDVD